MIVIYFLLTNCYKLLSQWAVGSAAARKGDPMPALTKEHKEQIERHRQQMLKVANTLSRSDYKTFAKVLLKVSEDITVLIDALEEDQE